MQCQAVRYAAGLCLLTGARDEIGAHVTSANPPRRPDFVEQLHREKSRSAAEVADNLSGANIRRLKQTFECRAPLEHLFVAIEPLVFNGDPMVLVVGVEAQRFSPRSLTVTQAELNSLADSCPGPHACPCRAGASFQHDGPEKAFNHIVGVTSRH